MRKLAGIDIGTNSMRLLLCTEENGRLKDKSKDLIITRMGEDISRSRNLSEKAMDRNIKALGIFSDKIKAFGAETTIAIATSAVRDADNKDIFVKKAMDATGIAISVISGDEEADLGISGVMSDIEDPGRNILVIDVGGGSTELVLGNNQAMFFAQSINAGTVRMTEQFVTAHPIPEMELASMRARLEMLFEQALGTLKREKIDAAIAIGGTATTAAAIYHKMKVYDPAKVHMSVLTDGHIQLMLAELNKMPLEVRYNVDGLQKERADVIPAGLTILEHVMSRLGIRELIISESDNLEGAVLKYLVKSSMV